VTTGLAAPRSRVHVHGPSSNSARDLDRAPDLLRKEAVVSRTDSNPRGPSAMRSCRVVQRKCRNLLDVVEVFEGQGKRRLGGEVACGCVVGQSCLIGVSSTSMTLRQFLPGWDALSVHHPTEASPSAEENCLPRTSSDLTGDLVAPRNRQVRWLAAPFSRGGPSESTRRDFR